MKSMFRAVWALLLFALMSPVVSAADAPVTEGYGSTVTVSTSWSNLVTSYAAMAGNPAFVHNIGTSRVVVFFTASGSAPSAGGIVLKPGETLTGTAANVWVRSIDTTGYVTVGRISEAAVGVPSSTSSSSTTAAVTSAAAGGLVAKASAGTLYGLNVTSAASAGYILVFNSTTVPADGTVTPARCLPLAANTGVEVNYRPVPLYFSTGISVAFSTTGCFTKTASATAFMAVDVK